MISKIEISNDVHSIVIGSGTKYGIVPDIEGLESADVRDSTLIYSGRDGGEVTDQLLGLRILSIKGTIKPDNILDHYTLRTNLLRVLDISKDLKVRIHLDDGRILLAYARNGKPIMPITHKLYSDFFFTLTCNNSVFFEDSGGSQHSVIINKKIEGGVAWPLVWPIVWGSAVGPTTATNTGTADSQPIILFHGIVSNPVLTNLTTGERVAISVVTSSTSDLIKVDTRENSATLNGGSIYSLVNEPRDFMSLEVGDNQLEFTTNSPADTGYAEVLWYDSIGGV